MHYELVTKENLKNAFLIQKAIWKDFPDASHFVTAITTKDNFFKYFIVMDEGNEIGITGIYPELDGKDTIWLGWFGVKEEYRSRGYGRQILLDTIEMCKKSPYKYFRLYTSEKYDNLAQPLYKKIMQTVEPYNNPNDENYENSTLIYSYSLKNHKIELWENKYIGIKEYEEQSKQSYELLNSKF